MDWKLTNILVGVAFSIHQGTRRSLTMDGGENPSGCEGCGRRRQAELPL
jgi:hypothetical protein